MVDGKVGWNGIGREEEGKARCVTKMVEDGMVEELGVRFHA